jgi:hypothetical protein
MSVPDAEAPSNLYNMKITNNKAPHYIISPLSCYFRSHKLNTLPKNVFSNPLNVCTSFNSRDQVLRTYKTDSIEVLSVLNFTVSHRIREEKFVLFSCRKTCATLALSMQIWVITLSHVILH